MSGRVYCYWQERDDSGKSRTRKSKSAVKGAAWAFEVTAIDPATGKRRSIGGGGFDTKKEASSALIEKQGELADDGPQAVLNKPSKMPLSEFLRDEWLAAIVHDLKPTTEANYRNLIDLYVAPHIGGLKVCEITPGRLGDLYRTLGLSGSRKKGPLSPRTVHHVHRMLTTAFKWAVDIGALRKNPANAVKRPKLKSRTSALKHWTPSQVGRFLSTTADDRLRSLWILAIGTGARRGELSALRWSDLADEEGILRIHRNRTTVGYKVVEGSAKTNESDREIELDDRLLGELSSHRSRQAEERLAWGPGWIGDRDDSYMFTRENGEPLHPQTIAHKLRTAAQRAGLPWIGVHGLRHTSAVLALSAGVPAKVVQQRLGHSSIAITMDIYSHVIEGMQREASEAITAAMGLG